MRKTTVYLGDDQKRELERLAGHLRRSESQLIRDAIDLLVKSEQPAKPKPGPIFSIPETLSTQVDDLLAEGFGRD